MTKKVYSFSLILGKIWMGCFFREVSRSSDGSFRDFSSVPVSAGLNECASCNRVLVTCEPQLISLLLEVADR